MEIKLVESPLWKRNAVIWFIFSAISFYGAGAYNSIFYLIAGILGSIQGIIFLTKMTSKTYLTLQDETVTIHLRQYLLGKKKIKYSEIRNGEVIGKDIKLHLKNGRVIKLRNDWLSYNDLRKIKKELAAHSISIS